MMKKRKMNGTIMGLEVLFIVFLFVICGCFLQAQWVCAQMGGGGKNMGETCLWGKV